MTLEERREYNARKAREYRAKHPGHMRKMDRERWKNNTKRRERHKVTRTAWKKRNPEKVKAWQRQFARNNPNYYKRKRRTWGRKQQRLMKSGYIRRLIADRTHIPPELICEKWVRMYRVLLKLRRHFKQLRKDEQKRQAMENASVDEAVCSVHQ